MFFVVVVAVRQELAVGSDFVGDAFSEGLVDVVHFDLVVNGA